MSVGCSPLSRPRPSDRSVRCYSGEDFACTALASLVSVCHYPDAALFGHLRDYQFRLYLAASRSHYCDDIRNAGLSQPPDASESFDDY